MIPDADVKDRYRPNFSVSCEECSHQDTCGLKLEMEQLWESDMAGLAWSKKRKDLFYSFIAELICERFREYDDKD